MTDKDVVLFEIMKSSLWSGEPLYILDAEEIKKELAIQAVEGIAAASVPAYRDIMDYRLSRFVRMLYVQKEVINALLQANIDTVVLKGTAAGIYYPIPYLRHYGDIDLLVRSDNYKESIRIISNLDGSVQHEAGGDVSSFRINGFIIDLHRLIRGTERAKEGAYISDYIMMGLDDIQWGQFDQPRCSFPMLPWRQNGLELIWHIRVHLYNGLGLRQVIDWMMFVYHCMLGEEETGEFLDVLHKAGLLKLAKVVTRMCQLYLGLDESITWCHDAEAGLCESLMEYILEQGNFGAKSESDKAVKVLTKYRNSFTFFAGMQQKGLREWTLAKKHIFLRPFAWVYVLFEGTSRYMNREGKKRLREDLEGTRKRIELFDQLYEEE